MLSLRNWSRRNSRRQPNRRVAAVQALEVRTMPAGTVMVAITATATTASVVITGDAAANDLAVDATAGQIVITGANSTSLSVRLNGGAAQSLAAGTPFTQTIPGTITTIDVTANLNDGDDSLTVSSNAITKLSEVLGVSRTV